MVYCTARISGASNPSGQRDQDVYLRALTLSGAVVSHLLIDALDHKIDAALVISNDSDLAFPVQEMRRRLPLGLVNPTVGHTAGKLRGKTIDGVGQHWWYQLQHEDLSNVQLPAQIWYVTRPVGW